MGSSKDFSIVSMHDLEAFTVHAKFKIAAASNVLSLVGLKKQLDFFNTYNLASALPYHGRYHSMWMVSKCNDMWQELTKADFGCEDHKALLLAALFHDFNHSGGVYPDSHNISEATDGMWDSMTSFETTHENGSFNSPEEMAFISKVKDIIEVTQYPFTKEPKTLNQQIIRDADILQGCTAFFEKTIYHDLYMEILISRPELNLRQYLEGQKAFHSSVVLFTEPGKEEYQRFKEAYLFPFWEKMEKFLNTDV